MERARMVVYPHSGCDDLFGDISSAFLGIKYDNAIGAYLYNSGCGFYRCDIARKVDHCHSGYLLDISLVYVCGNFISTICSMAYGVVYGDILCGDGRSRHNIEL